MKKCQYYNECGALIFVAQRGRSWASMIQEKYGEEATWLRSRRLPSRGSWQEAQQDLDAYASVRNWDIAE
jgi:hypothetical protein